MRALQFTEYGGPDVVKWADAPDPHAGPGQVRIAVRAASVNPIDGKVFAGVMSGGQPMVGTGYLGMTLPVSWTRWAKASRAYPSATMCSAAVRTPRPSTPS